MGEETLPNNGGPGEIYMLDLLIRGGRVVTPSGVGEFDVGVVGERIALVAERDATDLEARRVVDASGKYVLPGGIEPHTHIATAVSEAWAGRSVDPVCPDMH